MKKIHLPVKIPEISLKADQYFVILIRAQVGFNNIFFLLFRTSELKGQLYPYSDG